MQIGVWVMVFNATLNNISVISWRSVLLVEETEYPEKATDLPQLLTYFITYKLLNPYIQGHEQDPCLSMFEID